MRRSSLGFFLDRRQLAAALAEPRLPRTGIATGSHFGPAQFLNARLRRVRARLFPIRTGALTLQQRQQIARLVLWPGRGRKPYPPVDLDRRQVCRGKISVENRHALDDSAWFSVLPVPFSRPRSVGITIRCQVLHGSPERLRLSQSGSRKRSVSAGMKKNAHPPPLPHLCHQICRAYRAPVRSLSRRRSPRFADGDGLFHLGRGRSGGRAGLGGRYRLQRRRRRQTAGASICAARPRGWR